MAMNRQVPQPGPQQDDGLELDSDEYFMALAFLCSQRRQGPERPVGACIVNNRNVVVGTGFCGMPNCCDEHRGQNSGACHAEKNAISNKKEAGEGQERMYVTLHPCGDCDELIKPSQISTIVCYHAKFTPKARYRKYSETKNRSLTLDFSQPGKVLRPSSPEGTCGRLHLSDHKFFMSVAFLAATRSCLPTHERTGACLVHSSHNIISIGYQAPTQPLWVEGPEEKDTILNKDLRGCSIYVTHFPSKECAEAIVNAGITTIYFFHKNADATDAANIFASKDVNCVQYSSLDDLREKVTIDFESITHYYLEKNQ